MLKYVLFDLDGTLTDPALGITSSVAYALEKMGIRPPEDLAELNPFIGPPLVDSFMRFYGLSREEGERGLWLYREYFGVKGIFQNEVYPGVPEMLAGLKEAGVHVILATSKPEPYARRILEHFDLMRYFDFIGANDMSETRSDKESVIAYIKSRYPEVSGENTVMVGDRSFDILGGKAHGLRTVGVGFGYAAPGELEQAGADRIVPSVEALSDILKAYS